MIKVTIPKREVYDPATGEFHRVLKDTTIQLEHSLISLQKWEARWHKSFLGTKVKTSEEALDYVRCMCMTPNVDPDIFYCLPVTEMTRISEYIEAPMTATVITESGPSVGRKKKDIITAEVIYYWMITYNIPSEYKKWHLNQLLTLIRVLIVKNTPNNKKSKRATLESYKEINERNKKLYNTKG